jgi:hypothetical protein
MHNTIIISICNLFNHHNIMNKYFNINVVILINEDTRQIDR